MERLKLEEKNLSLRKMSILSYYGREKGRLKFLVLSNENVRSLLSQDFESDKSKSLSMKPMEMSKLFSARFLSDREKNGVYMYSVEHGIILAPRDTRLGETSMFVKDISMFLGTGILDTSFGNTARDLYLAEKLNDVDKELAIYYCTEEIVGNIVRPIGAVKVPKEPVWDEDRKYSTEGAKEKSRERYVRNKEKYEKEMSDIWKGEIKSRLVAEFGEERTKQLTKERKIVVKRCNPCEIVVLSYSKKDRKFLVFDPRESGSMVLCDEKTRFRVRRVSLGVETARKYGITLPLLESEGFLFFFEQDGEKGIIVPSNAWFTSDFCTKVGMETVCGGFSAARDLYLAEALKKNEFLKLVLKRKNRGGEVVFYEGVKVYTPSDEKDAVESIEVITNIKEYLEAHGFRQRSVRRDNLTLTIDFEMMDGDTPVIIKAGGKYDIIPGLEFSMSESTEMGYRLAGVFFYRDAVFYCGTYKYRQTNKGQYQHGSVYSKRKKYGEDVSKKLVNGFFEGDESAEVTSYSIYSYMLEQAGLFEKFCKDKDRRSPVFMNQLVREYDGKSVFDALAEEQVPIKKTLEQLLEKRLFGEFDIPKKMGKKKIKAIMAEIDKNEYGSKLDVLMLLVSLAKHESPLNYRSAAMQVPGDILGYYGYRMTADRIADDG